LALEDDNKFFVNPREALLKPNMRVKLI